MSYYSIGILFSKDHLLGREKDYDLLMGNKPKWRKLKYLEYPAESVDSVPVFKVYQPFGDTEEKSWLGIVVKNCLLHIHINITVIRHLGSG